MADNGAHATRPVALFVIATPQPGTRRPIVGDPSNDELSADEVPWVLGAQLTRQCELLGRAPAGSRVLTIEAHEFARRMLYHHELTLVFAATRRFRDRLRRDGCDVTDIEPETFADGLVKFLDGRPDGTRGGSVTE